MPKEDEAQALRSRAAKALNLPDIPDDEWEEVDEDGYVGDALDPAYSDGFDGLLRRLRKVRERKRKRGQAYGPRTRAEPRPPELIIALTAEEQRRADLVSDALGRAADALPPVRRFREQRLSWLSSKARDAEFAKRVRGRRESGFTNDLQALAQWLTKRFPWTVSEASSFLLGRTPSLVEPIRARTELTDYGAHRSARIVLEIEPWVSEDTVRKTYRFLQADMLGKRNRPLHRRVLAASRFIADRLDAEGRPRTSWKEIHAEWESQHEETERRDGAKAGTYHFRDHASMKRAYDDALARMLLPEYHSLTWDHQAISRGQTHRVDWYNPPPSFFAELPWTTEGEDGAESSSVEA